MYSSQTNILRGDESQTNYLQTRHLGYLDGFLPIGLKSQLNIKAKIISLLY